MAKKTLAELYREHLSEVSARADRAMIAGGYDGLIMCSGSPVYYYLDDNTYPFRPNPRYRAWLPDGSPDCYVVYRPGERPKLMFTQPDDYWYLPPERPEGYWVEHFDVTIVRSPAELRPAIGKGRWAILGQPGPATEGLGDHDPPAVTGPLDYARAVKTPYEIECMAVASAAGARAHRAAEQAFSAGASEYEIHLAYCRAAGAREEELPYNNIIGFDRHAAVLHYQVLDRHRPPGVKSFLIDAGAQYAGYACDITRTYAAGTGEFLDLIRSLDAAQQRLAGRVRPGVDYRDIHLEAHRAVAGAAGLPDAQGEFLSVMRYRPGEQYRPHFDIVPPGPDLDRNGQRIKTALLYLNDGYEGGETEFLTTGLKVKGRPGDVLVFSNVLSGNRGDPASRHAGLPVVSGEKWLASKWFRERNYDY